MATRHETHEIAGRPITVRPVRHCDLERLDRMFSKMSKETVYLRFFSPMPRVPTTLLRYIVEVDHGRRDALVALDGAEIVALASYDDTSGSPFGVAGEAEIALVVDDAWQRRGIGTHLVRELVRLAAARGFRTVVARTMPTNRVAIAFLRTVLPDVTGRLTPDGYEARAALDTFVPASPVAPVARRLPTPPSHRPRVRPELARLASGAAVPAGGAS